MLYDYLCKGCDTPWEASYSIDNRETPTKEPCPHCDKEGEVIRVPSIPGISYQGGLTMAQRNGSGWNDKLIEIKKQAGSSSTIETN